MLTGRCRTGTRGWSRYLACCVALGFATSALGDSPHAVRVRVHGPDGKLVSGATVAVVQPDGTVVKAQLERDGTYSFAVTDSKVRLMIEHANLGRSEVEMVLPDSAKSVADVELGPAGTLRAKAVQAAPVVTPVDKGRPSRAPFGAALTPMGLPTRGPGGADDCANATPISGQGTFAFDNSAATTDGPNHPACLAFGQPGIANDVWFCWTADADGLTTVQTCGLTGVDTKLAVYDGCGTCPPTDADLLDCNDDSCGLQSVVSFTAVAGNTYLIRVGTFPGASGGTGQIEITTQGGGGGGGGGADDCANAEPISGEGTFNFDNSSATTDGLPHAGCLAFGTDQIENDVWFCWTATFDGDATVQTCGGTGVDTKIAAYDGCNVCPPTDAELLACNDDSCGLQSSITFPVVNGQSYLIRIGTFPGAAPGAGTFQISQAGGGGGGGEPNCPTGVGCQIPDQQGHGASGTLAATSDRNPGAGFKVAENVQINADGQITALCWWGIYFDFGILADCGPGSGDDFQIVYYNDDAGGAVPGSVKAGPFSVTVNKFQTGNVLVAGSIVVNEWQFEATHPPVPVSAGECVWVEISNNTTGTCFWLWDTAPAGDNRSAQTDASGSTYAPTDYDLAVCLDVDITPDGCGAPPPPGNDNCADATAISGEGTFGFDNTFATTDGLPHADCLAFGTDQIENDVWYVWTAPCTGDVRFETCGLTGVDTKIAVYNFPAPCPPGDADLLACNDDDCGLQSGVVFSAVAGQQYLLRIGTFPGAAGGAGQFSMTCISVPDNDLCQDAIGPLSVPSITQGTTDFATVDTDAPFCGTSVTSPGVWYTVVGTGTTMTASLCTGATTYDAKLSVYCGTCGSLVCIDGNDDFCGLQSQVSWCSQLGATYYILVHGFGGATGPFELELTEDGVPCQPTVQCLPAGACCFSDGSCQILTADQCAAAGGSYAGDGTVCDSLGYLAGQCNSSFEDISSTGIPLTLGDDDGAVVPIGFTFNFFGIEHEDIGISSNGYLTFGPDLTDFTNDPIPTPGVDPDDFIAPLWDDLNPSAGGTIHYQTLGTAPHRRFIVQWTNVPQFGASDANTFQAVLFEGSNRIEFRYGQVTPEAFPGDYTIGVESPDGTTGASVPGTTAAADACVLMNPIPHVGACRTSDRPRPLPQPASPVPRSKRP